MTGQRASDLIIGIGNVLTHDDGVGVWASSMLSRLDLPDHIEVHDAGTVGLDATSLIEGRRKVVVLDALAADLEPGVICRMPAEELRPLVPATVSLHQVHLLDALDAAMLAGRPPGEVVFLAMQVVDTSTGIGLSEAVTEALPRLVRLACQELQVPERCFARLPSPKRPLQWDWRSSWA